MLAPRISLVIFRTPAVFSAQKVCVCSRRFVSSLSSKPVPTTILFKSFETRRLVACQQRTMATINELTRALLINSVPGSGVDSSDDAATISTKIYPQVTYTDDEKKEIDQWVNNMGPNADLSQLNTHLSMRTTILGSKPSVADVAAY